MVPQTANATDDVLLITSERFAAHKPPPGHPERVERSHVMTAVAKVWAEGDGRVAEPVMASTGALARVHAPEYIESVVSTGSIPIPTHQPIPKMWHGMLPVRR